MIPKFLTKIQIKPYFRQILCKEIEERLNFDRRILVTGYWLLVTGYWLLVTGYWLLVTGYWLLVTGYS